MDLGVEVFEQLPPSVVHRLFDLGVEIEAQLLELGVDRLGRAAVLVDRHDAALEVDARLDRAEHLIACAEHAREQAELLVEQLEDANVGCVRAVEEVDHYDIVLLAIAMAPPDALLDPLRVPGKVVVHDHRAELKVDPFGRGFGRDHDLRLSSELVDQCGAHVGRG